MSGASSMEETQQPAMPLNQSQIDAATELSRSWESTEFEQLKKAFPKPQDGVCIKAIVLNVLYGTNIIAIEKVAKCVESVLCATTSTGTILVEQLVSEIRSVTKRKNYSFASKYVHFFIDSNTPILDWYAEWMLAKHLGKIQSKNPLRYEKFVEGIETLRRVAGLDCTCADLDSYLWVAGEYWWWIEHRNEKIDSELLRLFEGFLKDPLEEPVLARLLGPKTVVEVHDRGLNIDLSRLREGIE